MSLFKEDSEERTIKEILEYFLRHPQSADSLEGIARWRLLDETIHRTLVETSRALEWLVSQGYLEIIQLPGSNQVYSLNQKMRDRAELIVEKNHKDTKKTKILF